MMSSCTHTDCVNARSVLTGLIGARAPVGHDVHAIGAGEAVVRVVGGGRVVGVHHGGGGALVHEPGGQSNAGHQGWRGRDPWLCHSGGHL